MWVGILHIDVVGSMGNKGIQERKAPYSLGSSMVNWMCGSWELICWRHW